MKKIKFNILPAHSGTSEKEIAKAKRIAKKICPPYGHEYSATNFVFTDSNGKIYVEIMDEYFNSYGKHLIR